MGGPGLGGGAARGDGAERLSTDRAGKLMKRDREDVSDAVGQAAPQVEWALAVAQRFNDAVSQAVSQQLAVHPEKITELAASNGRLHGEVERLTVHSL